MGRRYFITLPVEEDCAVLNSRMNDVWWIGKDSKEDSYCLIEVLAWDLPGGTEKY
jgi:hypothetical protein